MLCLAEAGLQTYYLDIVVYVYILYQIHVLLNTVVNSHFYHEVHTQ